MTTPPTRLGTAESAAEHIQWCRETGLSPRDAAAAIGWMVSPGAHWGMVTALYAAELEKVLDSGGRRWCHKTVKAGSANFRPAARGSEPRVSTAGEAAADVVSNYAKHRASLPISQPASPVGMDFYGLNAGRGLSRSEWRGA